MKFIKLSVFMAVLLVSAFVFQACNDDSSSSNPGTAPDMVLIPAGTFQMGNTGAYSGYNWEKPVHSVTISKAFYMSKYEITQKQFEEVMGTNPNYYKGENLPVEKISWYDAVTFCNALSQQEGKTPCYTIDGDNTTCNWDANGYRLPTEAEWEYACKAGTSTDFYNGSLTNKGYDPLDNKLDKIGWYCGNSNDKTQPVGQKQPNAFGLYDMSGNVFEWCWNRFEYYSSASVTDPKGANSGPIHVFRGGGYRDNANECRSVYRDGHYPDYRYFSIGFRVVSTK